MRRAMWVAGLALGVVAVGCGDGPTPVSVVSPTPVAAGGGGNPSLPGGAATVGYVQDIKPLLDSDCVNCHNSRNANGRVDLSTYASVMRTVRAGSANSALVVVTSPPRGSMYREWRGDRDAKANLVRSWVVDFQARENR